MSGGALVEEATVKRPIAWRYVAGALMAYPILLVLWLAFDFRILNTELINANVETAMNKLRWFGVPLAIVAFLFGGSWLLASIKADARERDRQQKTQHLRDQNIILNAKQARQEFALEVIGLGVTVEKYRQGKLWEVLQNGTPFTTGERC